MLALTKNTVRFTPPGELNDPFETDSFYVPEADIPYMHEIVREVAFNNYGILSLSRSALNPLMWAHYAKGNFCPAEHPGVRVKFNGDSHRGIVLGINTERAGLEDEDKNLIPARFGNVIYTNTKPAHKFDGSNNYSIVNGQAQRFQVNWLEALQRGFLYKSNLWSYEEEVRVVRNNFCESIGFPDAHERAKGIYQIPSESIEEVYLGSGIEQYFANVLKIKEDIRKHNVSCKIYICQRSKTDWGLKAIPIEVML